MIRGSVLFKTFTDVVESMFINSWPDWWIHIVCTSKLQGHVDRM